VSPVALTSAAVKALTAQETGEVFLMLITIAHPSLVPSLYFVNDTVDLISRGNTYLGWPFQVALPDEREDALPQVQLRIDNVDRRIMEGIRMLTTTPTVTMEVVLASSPDTVERGPFNFRLAGIDYDALVITGTLAPEDVLNEPACQFSFTPALFPGLFP
jgi:Domain of unknown function (DUF1833)